MSAYNHKQGLFGAAPPAGPNYRQSQTVGYGGENSTLPGYSSGYAYHSNTVPQYPSQSNASSGIYSQQDPGWVAYQQGMDGATGGYGYESQGNFGYSGQGSGGWSQNQSAWNGPTGGGGDQYQNEYWQGGGSGFRSGDGYEWGERGDGIWRGGARGESSDRVDSGQGSGRYSSDHSQEFGYVESYSTGSEGMGRKESRHQEDSRRRGINSGLGRDHWQGSGQDPDDDAIGGGMIQGQSFGNQGRGYPERDSFGEWVDPKGRHNMSSRDGSTYEQKSDRGPGDLGLDHDDQGQVGEDNMGGWASGKEGVGMSQISECEGPFGSKTFLSSGSGQRSSSLGATKKRQSHVEVERCAEIHVFANLLEQWQEFTYTFAFCGNAISTMESSLTASKVQNVKLNYNPRMLQQFKKSSYYCFVFTGSLYLNKVNETDPKDGIFLARGLGLSKKSAKLDAYNKAFHSLMNCTVEEILSQEDTSNHALSLEVNFRFNKDADGFWALLKKSGIDCDEGTEVVIDAARKRDKTLGRCDRDSPPKIPRLLNDIDVARIQDSSSTSKACSYPAASKKQEAVMSPSDSLFDRLNKLKELLKVEGITKLHIVPKIDQFGNKSALNIKNVYRYTSVPPEGEEYETPFFCEIYFDNILMSKGEASMQCMAAMHSAYNRLAERLCKEPSDSIVHSSKTELVKTDPDVWDVVVKQAGDLTDSVLTTNLVNLKATIQKKPDFSVSVDQIVLMELEAEQSFENPFKVLEMSSSLNCMLLECEIIRSDEQRFTCRMSIQGRQMSIRTSNSKSEAKRLCSEAILHRLKQTKDIVFVGKDSQGPVYTREHLLERSKRLMAKGETPLKCNLVKDKRGNQDVISHYPWLGRALADIILDHFMKITLEDFRIQVIDMPKNMKDMIQIVASKFGLRALTKSRDNAQQHLRRFIPALEVTKILGVNNGESGRYKLKQCKNPWTTKELEEYKNKVIAKYTKMHKDLVNGRDTEAELEI